MTPTSPSTAPADTRSSSGPAPGPSTENFAMNDMSISPTPSRTARCSAAHRSNHGARPQVGVASGVRPAPANQAAPSQPDTSRR